MGKYFGTDGIRNKAEFFTADFIGKVVLGLITYAKQCGLSHPRVLLGGDTRESTEWMLADFATALETVGVEYGSVEVMPTPGINYVFPRMGFDFAIDITASHNPYTDNGIKIFERADLKIDEVSAKTVSGDTTQSPYGRKLSAEGLKAIEQAIDEEHAISPVSTEPIESLHADALERYISHLAEYTRKIQSPNPVNARSSVDVDPIRPLAGLRVALDCADGATSVIGGQVFTELGAEVTVFNTASGYGRSINAGVGSTHLNFLSEKVRDGEFDFGAAFDGDGDRCLLVDHTGATVTGDQILAIIAQYLELKKLAITVMANQGIYDWAEHTGVELTVTDVGDTNVARAMTDQGILLGGEESGHVILPRETMGDGMLVALVVGKIIATTGQPLQDLAGAMPKFPQITVNVPASDKAKLVIKAATGSISTPEGHVEPLSAASSPESQTTVPDEDYSPERLLARILARFQQELATEGGRLLVRPSGTEALVRVTVWGKDLSHTKDISQRLSAELVQIFANFK